MLPALMLAATAAATVPAQVASDLRCLAVNQILGSSLPKSQRDMATAGAMYFVGRIDAQAPEFDYQHAMAALLADDQQVAALVKSDTERCTTLMRQRGAALLAVGSALTRQGKQ